jgi:hypothetical protein
MDNKYVTNILRFIGVLAIQLLILDNVHLVGFVVPVVYVYFIMKLPFGTKKLVVLFLAFLIGITIDLFIGTPGIHAAASTLTGFIRRYALKPCFGEIEDDSESAPSIKGNGFYPFLGYTALLLGIHITVFFILENIGYEYHWLLLSLHVLASVAFSIFLIILIELLVQSPQKKKRKSR